MKATLSPDGVDWTLDIATGDTLTLRFREIRRERTGVHALVAIIANQTILGHDTFNIGRREDRQRLAKSAHQMLNGELTKGALTAADLTHALDIAALDTPRQWEQERIQIVEYTGEEDPGLVEFIIKPFIIKGGGTIFYAAPGSGKSIVLQSMALAVAAPMGDVWDVQQTCPVLYVNLERDGTSMLRRELGLRKAMGIKGKSSVHYIHARGLPLTSIRQKVRNWLIKNEVGGVILDSVSRAQTGGSMTEDDMGNRFIDMMNSLEPAWWAAIGHTPRATGDHVFGSIMFDAGMDIGVKLSSEKRDLSLGISLKITKANDIGEFPPQYVAFDFASAEGPVTAIRTAKATEFPELLEEETPPIEERIAMLFASSGYMTIPELSKRTGYQQHVITSILGHDPRFSQQGRAGAEFLYGLVHE